jgi:serine/threonine protein kinase
LKISPETWKQVDPLFTTALEMTVDERHAWLGRLRERQPDLAPVLEELLAAHERLEGATGVETVPRLAAPPPGDAFAAGEVIGPFRLVRPLGRGGMGEVWLAEQADGRVERQVALKLPTLFEAGGARAERFRRERDILAKLEHPNIARLYDAGVSGSGQPWLAMEFVSGEPLDAHAATRKLRIRDRLALVRQVLAAVAHAHRFLVVHRDLKPANILVDAAGQVKLLDFGIAKLLVEEANAGSPPQDLTRMGSRAMTLRYAAPEQAAEGAITTATDVYALGVILHEFVTGASPYRAVREGRAFTQVALVQENIARPSSLALSSEAAHERGVASPRQLARFVSGDLDAILLKALRRDPADRYASAQLFDEDIRRHLESLPVVAREGTWRYLAGRYSRRHRLPIAAGAAIVVALAAGLVVAEAQRARAERHFAQVRKLANTFIFDVHGAIEKLPGSLAARQTLVKTSLEYLDSLAAETGSDRGLRREIASGYRKIAEIEGDTQNANVGEAGAARRHAERSVAMLEALDRDDPRDLATLRELRSAKSLLARLLKDSGDPAAIPTREAVVALADRAVTLPAATRDDRREQAAAVADLAVDLSVLKSDQPAARERIEKATAMLDALDREAPGDRAVRDAQASAYERASIIVGASLRPEDLPRDIELMRRSVDITESLFREDPLDQRFEQAVVKRLTTLAQSQRQAGDLAVAAGNLARARELGAAAWAREPGNAANAVAYLRALAVGVSVEQSLGRNEAAIAIGREVEVLESKLPESTKSGLRVRANVATARSYAGLAYLERAESSRAGVSQRLAMARQARSLLAQSRDFRQEMADRDLDAATSRKLVEQIGEAIGRCDAFIARLGG